MGHTQVPELIELSRNNLREHGGAAFRGGRIKLSAVDGWEGIPEVSFNAIHVGAAAVSQV